MVKARVSTHKGTVRELFGQWHVDFFTTALSEISTELAKEKVAQASGSYNAVKD